MKLTSLFMITMEELIHQVQLESLSEEIQNNLNILLERINKVRSEYGKKMIVTSGLRSMDDHLRIYAEKGITDKSKIPMKSKHLIGAAVDIYDPVGELNQWCKDNEEFLRDLGIWLEIRQGNWQHFQILPYKSYNNQKTIFFNP
ncbi:MAG: hypothetical protein EBZ95_04910 [Chitinophagia bacterium]|nr:hypothetical protein [Chitinophagia bacterium]